MNKEPVILAELVKEVLDRFRLKLDEKSLVTEVQLDEGVVVNGDYGRLDQVMENLLSNAIKFSATNRKIRILVREGKEMGVLKIEDEGVGIPEEDVPYIFERFYRVEKARTRKSGGTGLGLSIVQQIINKHEGKIHVDSNRGIGTVVTVELPLFDFQ